MKAKLSPLRLLDFTILNSSFTFTAPEDDSDLRKLYSEYPLDIDFAIVDAEEGIRIFIKSSINQEEEQHPGYSIFAEGVAIFELSETDPLSEEDQKSLLQYSAVSIALNSLRGFVSSLTANAPFGRYIMPSIDVNDLFQQKANQHKKKTGKLKRKVSK